MPRRAHLVSIRRSLNSAALKRSAAIDAMILEGVREDVAVDLVDCDNETFVLLLNVVDGVEFHDRLPQPRRVA